MPSPGLHSLYVVELGLHPCLLDFRVCIFTGLFKLIRKIDTSNYGAMFYIVVLEVSSRHRRNTEEIQND